MTVFQPDDPRSSATSPGRTGPEDAHARAFDRVQGVMVAAMAAALVLMGIVLPIIGAELVTPDPLWPLWVVLAATVLSYALVLFLPAPRSPHGHPAAAAQTLLILRAAILEAPAILGFALSLITSPPSLLVYLLPAGFALAGIWLFARPSVVRARVSRAA